jgi:hypothetical protein
MNLTINNPDIKWWLKSSIGSFAIGQHLLMLKSRKKDLFVSKNSDVLIEGFPRSGNTFALASFIYFLNNSLNISSHRHEIGNIKRAIRLKKKVLVIVRNPRDSVCSFIVREKVSGRFALGFYLKFHKFVLMNRHHIKIIKFEDLIHHPKHVVNTFFNIDRDREWKDFNYEINQIVNNLELKDSGLKSIREDFVAIPSKKRNRKKQRCFDQLEADLKHELEKAEKTYQQLLEYRVNFENTSPS